jgi:hypothetical protein
MLEGRFEFEFEFLVEGPMKEDARQKFCDA